MQGIVYARRGPFVCRCGRGGFINPINFIVNQPMAGPETPPTVLHFKSQSLTARVENSIAIIDLEQVFLNELDSPVEATYQFPTDPDSVVSRVRIELGDKVVEGKVQEKKKAQERYDDAIAGGDAAVMVQEDEKDKDLLKMSIGGIQPS